MKDIIEIDILNKITKIISNELDFEKVLKKIVNIISEISQADSAFLYLYDGRKKNLILKASKTYKKNIINNLKLKKGEGITGWVAQKNRVVCISRKAYNDHRFKTFDLLKEDKYEAFLSVPIIYKREPIGVINIQHKKKYKFSQTMIKLIKSIAIQVGGLIENARLYEENKLKAEQFDSIMKVSKSITKEKYLDEILNLIAIVASNLFDSKICSIMLVDEKGKNLIVKATKTLLGEYIYNRKISIINSISGETVMSKQPIIIYDVKQEKKFQLKEFARKENLTSMISVPMIIKNKVIGIINIYTKTYYEFSESDINVLKIIANQAAVSIENTNLMQEIIRVQQALETRKLIEKAKGLLMNKLKITESEAYKLINKRSMDTSKPMKEIAEAIIIASAI